MSKRKFLIILSHILEIEKKILKERGIEKPKRLKQNVNFSQYKKGWT